MRGHYIIKNLLLDDNKDVRICLSNKIYRILYIDVIYLIRTITIIDINY
jgi:hypothetical protein